MSLGGGTGRTVDSEDVGEETVEGVEEEGGEDAPDGGDVGSGSGRISVIIEGL